MEHTPHFFGREKELDRLERLLDDVLEGKAKTVFIAGDAGSGKSTLVEAFVERAQNRSSKLLATLATCDSQAGQSDAYLPFLETISQLTGDSNRFESASVRETNSPRLKGFFKVTTRALLDDAPELIGNFIPGGSLIFHAINYTAEKAGWLDKIKSRKKLKNIDGKLEADKIFQLYADLLAQLSKHAPMVFVLEDLHWVDQSSAQLLFYLSRRLVDSPIMFLGTYRANDLAIGRGGERHPLLPILNELKRIHGDITIELGQETESERKSFVSSLIDAEENKLSSEFRQAFLEHTNGHPLFSQELLLNMQEKGVLSLNGSGAWVQSGPIDWADLPPRVEGVIEERIDRLDENLRDIASSASIQGKNFLVQVLARLLDASDRELLRTLSRQLEDIHGLVKEGDTLKVSGKRLTRYHFSHNLFQQYLYNEMSRGERINLHADVGELLEEHYGESADEIANLLAYHFAAAEDWERAIPYYLAAAKRSLSVSSYENALDLLSTALEKTPELAPDEAALTKLKICLEMGHIYQALRGFTNPDAEENFRTAREIAEAINEPALLALAIYGLWEFNLFQLDLEVAQQLANEIEGIGQQENNQVVSIIAYRALANGSYQKGDLAATIENADKVVENYDPDQANDYIVQLTYDPKLFVLGLKSWSQSLNGDLESAEQTSAHMFAWGEELNHPLSTCVAHLCALKLHYNLGDIGAIGKHAAEMQKLAGEYGFSWYNAFGELFGTWHATMTTSSELNIEEQTEKLKSIYHESVAPDGNLIIHSQFCRMMSEVLLEFGKFDQALNWANKGIEVSEAKAENIYLGELIRIRGVILLQQGATQESFEQLRRSIAITGENAQKLFQLRAMTSLCQALLSSDEPSGEAIAQLGALLDSFSDKAKHADLEKARALI
ncbi:MAG: BREX system ATP-binding domain-containing protein [Halioglobus sp.]